MALTTFYKRPFSEYNSSTHGSSIFSCSDTGEAYLFGSKIKIKWEDVINPPTIGSAVAWSDITDKPSWIDSSTKPSYNWSEIGGKPSTFTPSAHIHSISEVTNLQTTLDDKVSLSSDTFKPNNTCWGGTKTDGTTMCLAFINYENIALFGHTSLPLKLRSSSNPTVAVGSNTYTLLHTGNLGTITFTGAVSAIYNGQSNITVNIPTAGGGVADSVDWSNVTNKPNFATVATSGDYNDLTDKPTIPSLSGYATQTWVTQQIDTIDIPNVPSWALSSSKPSYSYSEISGTIPAADLPMASSDTLGGIRVGAGLSISSNGTLSATGGGTADSVDWENVVGKPSWIGSSKPSYSWNEISSKPSTFTPSAHTHDFDEINFGNTGSNTEYLAGNGYFYTIRYSELSGTPDLSQYATKSYVQEVVGQGGSVDLSNYVTLDGTQTITGTKTFTQYTVFSNGAGTSSDKRLKKNIQALPIEEALKVLELQGMKYHFIPTDKNTTGLIAQEVEKIIPEAVITAEDGLKSVDTYPIIAYMIEVIKDLRKEVEDLKRKIQLT